MTINNADKYINNIISLDFINDNLHNKDLEYYEQEKSKFQSIKEKIYNNESLTLFEKYCMTHIVPLNIASKLYSKGFRYNFTDKDKYTGSMSYAEYYEYDQNDHYLDIRGMYHYRCYNYSPSKFDFDLSNLINVEDIDIDNSQRDSDYYPAPNINCVLKWLQDKEKITILDKSQYIMGYINDVLPFKLIRTNDNDVYFYEDQFEEFVTKIFQVI